MYWSCSLSSAADAGVQGTLDKVICVGFHAENPVTPPSSLCSPSNYNLIQQLAGADHNWCLVFFAESAFPPVHFAQGPDCQYFNLLSASQRAFPARFTDITMMKSMDLRVPCAYKSHLITPSATHQLVGPDFSMRLKLASKEVFKVIGSRPSCCSIWSSCLVRSKSKRFSFWEKRTWQKFRSGLGLKYNIQYIKFCHISCCVKPKTIVQSHPRLGFPFDET